MEPRMRSGKNNTVMRKRLRTVCPAGADYFFALHEPFSVLIYRANQGTQIFGNETLRAWQASGSAWYKASVVSAYRSVREVPLCFAGRQITLRARESQYLEL